MQRLSNEILFKIFDYLPVPDKNNCIRVSTAWKFLMLEHNFFEDLKIKGERNLLLCKKYFQENEHRRKQVHRLKISPFSYGNASHFNMILAFGEQFPNLREFVYSHEKRDTEGSDESKIAINKENARHWQGITKFHMHDKYPVSSELLKHGKFLKLVELSVSFGKTKNSSTFDKCYALIQHLSNAPNLKTLKLTGGKMAPSHLQQLHCKVEQLEVLWFTDMDLVSAGVNEQRHLVSSSETLRELQLEKCTRDFNESVLDNTNYSNLKILKAHITFVENETYGEAKLVEFVSRCQHLETYSVNIHPITPAIMKGLDASGIQLKELTILGINDDDTLGQLESLRASKQEQSVSKMRLSYVYYHAFNKLELNQIVKRLKDFPKVKHLEMVAHNFYRFPSLPIDKLLNNCRNLETLKLKDWKTHVGFELFKTSKSNLKTLVLSDVHCLEKLLPFVSKACPKLSDLTILPRYNDAFPDIDFSGHNFASLTLDKPLNRANYQYQVTNDKGTKWYKVVDGTQEKIYEECPEAEKINMVSVKYKSCTALKLGRCLNLSPRTL